jgi:hypothetical protein
VVMLLTPAAILRAASFDATFGSVQLTIVETDTFKNGDPGGNTQRVDGSGAFWASTSNSQSDGLWQQRAFSAFATPYTAAGFRPAELPAAQIFEVVGADIDTFNGAAPAPALRTTISGLTSARYEIFLVYMTRHDGNAANARITATLNTAVTPTSTIYDHTNATVALAGTSVWDAAIASLGIINNATDFFVEVAGYPFDATAPSRRCDYVGVGYRIAPPVAIPGDFDADGDVDGADFVAWQTNFPKAANAILAEGDADADGDVDGADFVVWQTNFPFTPSPGVTPIPEPSAFVMTGIMMLIGAPIGKRMTARRT